LTFSIAEGHLLLTHYIILYILCRHIEYYYKKFVCTIEQIILTSALNFIIEFEISCLDGVKAMNFTFK